eukprot:726461_1
MATAFDILCAFPVDYIMRLASVRYISPYRLGRMFSMFSVPGRFTKLERIYEEFKGSSNTALWRMAHYTFYYIMASHLTGCVFFYIAQDEYFSGSTSWYYAQVGEAELSSIWTQYINSIYWAIVTMTTVGFGDRIPITTLETVFVVFVEFLGLALTCTIVANLSTLVANMDSAVGDFQRQMDDLAKYMDFRDLPANLRRRIRDFHEYVWSQSQGVDERTLLDGLPTRLAMQVAGASTKDVISKIEFFKSCDENLLSALAMQMETNIFSPGSFILSPGQYSESMFILKRGDAEVLDSSNRLISRYGSGDVFNDLNIFFKKRVVDAVCFAVVT